MGIEARQGFLRATSKRGSDQSPHPDAAKQLPGTVERY